MKNYQSIMKVKITRKFILQMFNVVLYVANYSKWKNFTVFED